MSTLERPQRASAAEAEARINAYTQDRPLLLGDPGEAGSIERNHIRNSKEMRHIVRNRLLEIINHSKSRLPVTPPSTNVHDRHNALTFQQIREYAKHAPESAIGRDIIQRNRKPIDPRLNDLKPPNLYKWTFTPEYSRFPEGPIGRWSSAAHEACLQAVDQGWLSVLALPSEAAGDLPHGRVDVDESSEDQRCLSFTNEWIVKDANKQCNIDEDIRFVMEQIEAGDEMSSLRESCSKIDDLILKKEAAHREADELLDTHRKHLSGIKKNIFESAISKTKLLEDAAKDQSFRYQQLKTRYEELQKEFIQVSRENLALKQRLDHHLNNLDQERRLGELEDLRTAIQDLRYERDAQFQRHLIQLRKARDESRQEGFRKGEASAISKSSSAALIADLKRQLEENHANHAIEVARAREEGRREDEVLNHLLEGRNLLYKGRKRREIRTIYSNWKNIPQNILPKLMLPDGVMLGDKTLILLARLSRVEHDPHKATALLQRVVELRNSQLAVARKEPVITNADIEKVLANLGVADSSRRNSEMSSTPQTESSQDVRSVHNLSPCPIHPYRTGSSTHGIEKVSSATPSSQVEENDKSTTVVDLGRPPMPHQNIPKSLHPISTTEMESEISVRIFSQPSALESQRQTITEQIDLASSINRTIHEEIDALHVLRNSLVPSTLQHFPMDFTKESIRGDNSTFAKCGRTMLDKQLVAWPEMIKLNPEIHPLCPSQGSNGALTFVDGRPNVGEIGKTYPTLLREKVGFYKYIGHYKVVKRVIMPVATWKACALEERLGVAEEIESREWGRTLLTLKGLCTNATDVEEKRINDILEFFEKPLEPCLRISWTLLQFMSFKRDDYNLLLGAFKEWEMEEDFEDDASSVGPKILPRSSTSQSPNQDTEDNIQRLDGLPSSSMLVTEREFERINHYTAESNEAAKRHNEPSALGARRNGSPVVLEIRSSGQVTSTSVISISDGCESSDDFAPAEDGQRHVHASKDLRPSPTAGSATEKQVPGARAPSPHIKRLYEEDIYGVSPPRRVSSDVSKTRTPASIFSSFARAKKRKLSPYTEDVENDHS